MLGLLLELSKLEKAKMLIDAGKTLVDGWAVIDERRRLRREEERNEKMRDMEKRLARLEESAR